LGITNTSGVSSTTISATLTLDDLARGVATVRAANEHPQAMVSSLGIESQLSLLKDGDGHYLWPDGAPGCVKDLKAYIEV